jgi:hypothetical protein
VVYRIGGEFWVWWSGCCPRDVDTRDPRCLVAIGAQWAVNFTSPRRFRRSGWLDRVRLHVRALVSIYFVIGYVKGMRGPQLEGVD